MKNTQPQTDRPAIRQARRTLRSRLRDQLPTRPASGSSARPSPPSSPRVLSARAGFMVAASVTLTVVVGSAIVAKELFVRAGIAGLNNIAAVQPVASPTTPVAATNPAAPRVNTWEGEASADATIPLSRTEEDILDWAAEPETQPLLASPPPATPLVSESAAKSSAVPSAAAPKTATDLSIRYFNGRPVRPARTITMTVTAYTPDEFCCAGSADGITASLHHVTTNGHALVAADSRVLPLGSIITVPGYDNNQIVPVLDRGGKIKGNRLDVLFPDRPTAKQWGVKKLKVTVWEYADGQGKENWRKLRDSK